MKIVDMRVTPCRIPVEAPLRHSWGGHPALARIVVELETDEGIIGLGEATGEEHRLLALERAKGVVLGEDPYNLERLRWRLMNPGIIKLWQGPIAYHTYAAVEFACLDIVGQATGRPVHDLLGGRLRDRIRSPRTSSTASQTKTARGRCAHRSRWWRTRTISWTASASLR